MSSDEFIQDIIKNRGLILAMSGLDDERATLKMVSYLKEIRGEKTKVISLVGGAASGKSTLARRIANSLENAAIVGTDDFLLGSREYRRRCLEGGDPSKKYGFDLLREKVNRIRNLRPGESESAPVYDEEDGTAIEIIDFDPETGQILSVDKNHYHRKVGKVEYLIIEGDFQPLANPDYQISFQVPDDVRLRNRIDRDAKQRGAVSMTETVGSFELRQRLQHRRYTLTCANNADLLITVRAIRTDIGYKYAYSFWVPIAK